MIMKETAFAIQKFLLCLSMTVTIPYDVHGKIHGKGAFIPSSLTSSLVLRPSSLSASPHKTGLSKMVPNDKDLFLESLDKIDMLNIASSKRTNLLQKMIDNKVDVAPNEWEKETRSASDVSSSSKSLQTPGLRDTFNKVAEGNWKVIYAPHMTTIAGLFGGKFDVQYIMYHDNKMTSHARYDFPIIGRGFLSVSGTYNSVDENISRVDFDKAWVKPVFSNEMKSENGEDCPYSSLNDVPDGPIKNIINAVGRTFFIEQFSVFPISFLDKNMIVFDFPLLGTRICALKQ